MASLALLTNLLGPLLAPPRCAACDAPLPRDVIFCAPCAATVVRDDDAPGPVFAATRFGGAVADVVRRFKFSDRPDLARPLGELLRPTARRLRGSATALVPVPLHPSRLAERGYNQAALLARWVADDVGAPALPGALARVVPTAQQVGLARDARLANVRGAFVARDTRLCGARVLLVDDVATTGATLAACADALRAAGARSVTALVVARAEGPGHDGAP